MDWNKVCNWFEDDELAKDWFNRCCDRMAWEAFRNQEDWVYVVGELGKGRKPMIKSYDAFAENFIKYFDEAFFDWMRTEVIFAFLKMYYDDDIDVPQELADEYNEYNGYKPDDLEYMEGRKAE